MGVLHQGAVQRKKIRYRDALSPQFLLIGKLFHLQAFQVDHALYSSFVDRLGSQIRTKVGINDFDKKIHLDINNLYDS